MTKKLTWTRAKIRKIKSTIQYHKAIQKYMLETGKFPPAMKVCVSCGKRADARGCEDRAGFLTHPAIVNA